MLLNVTLPKKEKSILFIILFFALFTLLKKESSASYFLRNGAGFNINVYDQKHTLLGTLGTWSPSALDISSFPIYITDDTDRLWLTITKPGCYVFWWLGAGWTTPLICSTEAKTQALPPRPKPPGKVGI